LGIKPDVLSGNVIGIVAQRLLRKLCSQCKAPYEPSAFERKLLGTSATDSYQLFRPVGCAECEHLGYKGRLSILELLKFDSELDELVTQRASLKVMTQHVRQQGFVTMAEDGLRRVREGITTIEEVGRVVDLTELVD
jgi:type II secretory ATPase GspE/PulE/Tfp pilus assembly ATPase PilB-like protein